MYAALIALRIIHVIGAIFWLGGSLFLGAFLMPSLAAAGPAGGVVMAELAKRKLLVVMPTVATLTMAAGITLMWMNGANGGEAYYKTHAAKAYSIGAVLAILAFILFMSTAHQAIKKALKLGAQIAQAPDAQKPALMAELNATRARGAKFGGISGMLLLSAAILMAIGRYI